MEQENKTPQNTNFQQCAHLEIPDIHSELGNVDTLTNLMDLQKNIQEQVYGYNFEELQNGPLSELKKFIDWNEEAIRDEQREFATALGGVHSHGNNLWKNWKSKHKEANAKSLKDLTQEELLELKYEMIDIFHFMFSISISIGLSGKEFFNMYHAKNLENKVRQATGNY